MSRSMSVRRSPSSRRQTPSTIPESFSRVGCPAGTPISFSSAMNVKRCHPSWWLREQRLHHRAASSIDSTVPGRSRNRIPDWLHRQTWYSQSKFLTVALPLATRPISVGRSRLWAIPRHSWASSTAFSISFYLFPIIDRNTFLVQTNSKRSRFHIFFHPQTPWSTDRFSSFLLAGSQFRDHDSMMSNDCSPFRLPPGNSRTVSVFESVISPSWSVSWLRKANHTVIGISFCAYIQQSSTSNSIRERKSNLPSSDITNMKEENLIVLWRKCE
jgi:hypothetical protein